MSSEELQLFIYQCQNGSNVELKCFDGNTLWATQQQIATLFGVDRSVIVKHIQNVIETQELKENSTCAFFAQVQKEGNRQVERQILHYNLDMIIAVGYRVNSAKATQFRIWATKIWATKILRD